MSTNESSPVRLKTPDEILAETIRKKADMLAEIRRQQERLKAGADELEGWFLAQAETELRSTKVKTLRYAGSGGNQVTATMAASVKVLYPSLLENIFGKAYSDAVTIETTPKYKLSAPASRLLTGLYLKNYTKTSVEDVLRQAAPDKDVLGVLLKKVKGNSFETDKKNLMAIAGLDEQSAEEYAYFVAEAAVWENYQRLLEASQMNAEEKEKIIKYINTAVVVEETPKITVDFE